MKPTNIKETLALIDRYRSITGEEIDEVKVNEPYHHKIMKQLTGFGSPEACTLCTAISKECLKCIHFDGSIIYPCTEHYTYGDMVYQRETPAMLRAYKARADYLEQLIKEWDERDV